MKKLSEKEYWDSIYKNYSNRKILFPFLGKFKEGIKNISRDYSNYLMWEVLYPKYLPTSSAMKVLEIGCAPATHIISLNRRFGYIPYGVEYSEAGCEISRENFVKAGLPPEHIIQTDFLDKDFQSKNTGVYDSVVSLGFIEHFDNAGEIVGDHVNLIRDKGYLIILIPNLRGLNYYALKFLNPESLAGHNLSIMDKGQFRKLFENKNLDFIFCDYVGTFSFGLFNTNSTFKYYLWRIALLVQRPFDFVFRVFLGKRYIRGKYTSPYLLFIGKKK